jgi:serine/threonine protein kinase
MENRVFLERYRLSLGRNGLPVELHRSPAARTYRAQEIETGREVALTLVSPAPNDPALLEELATEATAAKKINQMNIPRLYDFGRENEELIYVDEYCEGHTAAAWVAARGPLPIAAVLRVALQVVDAMNATAFQRLHHHALNPDNILFVAGQTVEGDWPPVKVLHWFTPAADLSGAGDARVDSAARFASPEQIDGAKVDVRSEIYSLGVTMWFLLTGVPPVSEPKVSGENVARIAKDKLRGVPKIMRHLLDRMLRANPAERPQDPVALAAYLQTCLARVERRAKIERRFGIPLVAKPRVVEPKVRTSIPVKPLALAAGLLALAALGISLLPWSLTHKRSATVAEKTTRLADSLPNEVPVVTRDALGRMDETAPNSSPAFVAKASNKIPRGESTPAAIVAADDGRNEIRRDEFATTATNSPPLPEPPAPAEGPAESVPAPASVASTNPPKKSETSLPSEPESDASVTPRIIAETNQPHDAVTIAKEEPKTVAHTPHSAKERKPVLTAPIVAAADANNKTSEFATAAPEPAGAPVESGPALAASVPDSSPAETSPASEPESEGSVTSPSIVETNEPHDAATMPTPADVAPIVEEKPKSVANTARSAEKIRSALTKGSTTNRKSPAVAERTSTRSRKVLRLAHTAKRAKPLPNLRVGSTPAELVGTTSDGRWILSVSKTGQRIIVPPPPGYGL